MPLSDIFAAIRWWAVLMILGAAVTPLAYTLFGRLADRGYAFVKMLGLLLVSYLFWLLGSFGFLGNNVGGIVFALAAVFALSMWAYWRIQRGPEVPTSSEDHPSPVARRPSLVRWLRENWRRVVITELVFALIFAFWVWVRAQNPAITATEKPMEFAFLNAVGRSPSFPPLDPWLSGYAISYYYFGYVMTSVIARLAAVPEPVAFNLGIAWLIAGTGTGAFGLVYNLVAGGGRRRIALLLGLLAALALPIAGNQQITLEVIHAGNVGSAQFWQWLNVRDVNTAPDPAGVPRYETTNWWWWRASRVIHEHHLSGRAEEGLEPIAEFPAFSFVLGDMHPHVLALPFAFLSLAIAYLWYLETGDWRLEIRDWRLAISNLQSLIPNLPLWGLTALVLGGLSFLNTWDVLIHLFVVLGAFLLGRWRRTGWDSRLPAQTLAVGVLLVVPAVLLYLPFYLGFRSQAGPPFLLPMLMRPTRLAHFLIIFGMPLWSISILLVALAFRQRFRHWRAGIATSVIIVATLLLLMLLLGWIVASSADAGRVINLANELGVTLPPRPEGAFAPGWGLTAVVALLPAIIQARLQYPGVTLLLATLLALVVMAWIHIFNETTRENDSASTQVTTSRSPAHPLTQATAGCPPAHPSPLPFVLLLIFTGILLTLGPEFVYLRDNFGVRLNTVFKFYYQAWVMFGVAALFGLDYLWREFVGGTARVAPAIATAGYAIALLLALMFPYYAIQSRAAEYRGAVTAEIRQPATLDGLAQLNRFNPDEYDAIMWLRQNISGTPVIVEAVGPQYSPQGHGRVSASTGLPTLLGWAGHEFQWRGSSTQEPGLRDPVVQNVYTLPGWEETADLLNRYNVEYIYVGGLELSTYGPRSREKFSGRLPVAYQNDSVTIYRWQPQQVN